MGSWARFLAPFERLQGKQGLHNLPPEAGLVPAQPIDELVVEVGQSQVADGDVARRAPPTSAVTFWADLVSAVRIGGKLFARFGVGFGEQTRRPIPSAFNRFLAGAPAVNPWRRALPREARFPLVLVGPVLWSALRRLDSICLGEVMLGAVQPRPGRAAYFSDFGL